LTAILLFSCSPGAEVPTQESNQAKLVIGIVIDQRRDDYLTRYWDDYSDRGFKRLISTGFSSNDHQYSYAPTYTGPGHATVYSGTTPEVHGIIANDWYDRVGESLVYCVKDTLVQSIGTNDVGGQMSPHRFLSTSLCDQLELATNSRSKTIAISLKDRGAVLPAGHSGDGAYWFIGGDEGKWVSSSWYMSSLPKWVDNFNASGVMDNLMDRTWELLLNDSVYDESYPDNNPFEGKYVGKDSPTFPYELRELAEQNGNYSMLKVTPMGNTMVVDFAKAAILAEEMGTDNHPDLLSVSLSSTDYVGHKYGPMALETQDTYLRLDQKIADFLEFVDQYVGLDNTLIFLTADHGGAHVPNLLKDRKIPVDYWQPGNLEDDVRAMLSEKYGTGEWLLQFFEDRFYLNRPLIHEKGLDLAKMQHEIADFSLLYPGVASAYTARTMSTTQFTEGLARNMQRGFHQKISGDVMLLLKPGWMKWGSTGTTHESGYIYDTHVPMVFSGWGVSHGETHDQTNTRDIAPTVAAILKIQPPIGCTGRVISDALK
jgi:predicted AlkP superfamily pyrophosphatase or phosphodiesterase